MNKFKTLILVSALSILAFTGCSGNSDIKTNKEFSQEEMVTITGETVNLPEKAENVFYSEIIGFGFLKPTSWDSIDIKNLSISLPSGYEMNIDYIQNEYIDRILSFDFENSTQEDANNLINEIETNSFKFMRIYRVDNKNDDSKSIAEEIKKSYTNEIHVGDFEDNSYYIAYNNEFNKELFAEDEIANVEKLIASVEEVKNNMILFPPKEMISSSTSSNVTMKGLSAKDINGNDVTDEIFKDYDVTMVNIWATSCGYCIEEMPELQELYETLPEKANLISICADADMEVDLAKEILDTNGCKFTTLVPGENINDLIINKIIALPTTIFVNSEGEMIGTIQTGLPAQKGEITEAYLEIINGLL